MAYIIAGLGNPGGEYANTRHNTGRMMLFSFAKTLGLEAGTGEGSHGDFKMDKKLNALIADATVGSGKKAEKVKLVAPETFMNNSGKALAPLVTSMVAGVKKASPKKAEQLIVIYDDFNLPLGRIKVSFNRSSGGHNGLESIIKAVKTEGFIRIRVGVAPETAKGTAKVPHGDSVVEKFILGPFKPAEASELKKVSKLVNEAIELLVLEGREKAMSVCNAN